MIFPSKTQLMSSTPVSTLDLLQSSRVSVSRGGRLPWKNPADALRKIMALSRGKSSRRAQVCVQDYWLLALSFLKNAQLTVAF